MRLGEVLPADTSPLPVHEQRLAARATPGLSGTLGRNAFANSRADTFLVTRYRRLARRRAKQKAIVATGNSVLTVVYYVLRTQTPNSLTSGPDTTNPGSTNTAAPATSPPSSGTHRQHIAVHARQSCHHRHCRLIPNSTRKNNTTWLARAPSACPTHHPIFGSGSDVDRSPCRQRQCRTREVKRWQASRATAVSPSRRSA